MKKFLSLLLCFSLIMGITLNVSASQPSSSRKTVEYISQNWIESQLDHNAEVSETIRLYDTTATLIG